MTFYRVAYVFDLFQSRLTRWRISCANGPLIFSSFSDLAYFILSQFGVVSDSPMFSFKSFTIVATLLASHAFSIPVESETSLEKRGAVLRAQWDTESELNGRYTSTTIFREWGPPRVAHNALVSIDGSSTSLSVFPPLITDSFAE